MTPHTPEEFSTRLIDWSPFVIMGNTIPPRDPDEDVHPTGRWIASNHCDGHVRKRGWIPF